MRTVLALLGALLFVSCAVLILAGWRNPRSRFLVGMLQSRNPSSTDPKRTSAAACWLILGCAAGSIGLLVSVLGLEEGEEMSDAGLDSAFGYACAVLLVVCLAVATWVRFGDAPAELRPATLQDSGHAPND